MTGFMGISDAVVSSVTDAYARITFLGLSSDMTHRLAALVLVIAFVALASRQLYTCWSSYSVGEVTNRQSTLKRVGKRVVTTNKLVRMLKDTRAALEASKQGSFVGRFTAKGRAVKYKQLHDEMEQGRVAPSSANDGAGRQDQRPSCEMCAANEEHARPASVRCHRLDHRSRACAGCLSGRRLHGAKNTSSSGTKHSRY